MASAATSPCCELLSEAASLVLKDDGFNVPSEPARRARFMAERYVEWCVRAENKRDFELFSQGLVEDLEGCFSSQGSAKKRRERMWESFYKLRSSNEFIHRWADHLAPTCGTRMQSLKS